MDFAVAPDVFRQRLLIDFVTQKNLTKKLIEQFLKDLVQELKLRSYGGPIVYKTGGIGKQINQGYDGFIALIDSGISISVWRDAGLVSLFVHTCKEFSEEQTIKFIQQNFQPIEMAHKSV